MKTKHIVGAVGLALVSASPVRAGVFADDLARCVVSATTPADRIALMRWMFVAASGNPAFRDLARVSETQSGEATRAAAAVFNRLLLRACRRETVAAMRGEGAAGIEAGFQALGLVAGREMMNAPEVAGAMERLTDQLDTDALDALMREAGMTPPSRPNRP